MTIEQLTSEANLNMKQLVIFSNELYQIIFNLTEKTYSITGDRGQAPEVLPEAIQNLVNKFKEENNF